MKCNNCGMIAPIKKKFSLFGVLGFVFSFLCCLSIVGLILCIIDVCSNGKKNRIGLSIAGIVISSVMLIFSFFVGASAFGNSNKQEKPKTESFEEFKNSCEEFDYSKVAREPSKYKGKRYCFKANKKCKNIKNLRDKSCKTVYLRTKSFNNKSRNNQTKYHSNYLLNNIQTCTK